MMQVKHGGAAGQSSLPEFEAECEAEIDPAEWQRTIAQSLQLDQAQQLAGYGSCWRMPGYPDMVLSVVAADYLGVAPGLHADAASCLIHVVADDAARLCAALLDDAAAAGSLDCEFRLNHPQRGTRWLRMQALRATSASMACAMVTDVTQAKHAALREKFNFALTQHLIGSNTLGEALNKILQLVCEELGWEWGAYWACNPDMDMGSAGAGAGAPVLSCQHAWHRLDKRLAPFKNRSDVLQMAPGEGLVGRVWQTGQALWVAGIDRDPDFLRRTCAIDSGLQSGYIFPVTYVSPEGVLHSPGVLEFFSTLPRQREAQLPDLAASIGALIAQAVQRMAQQECIRRLALVDDMTGLANRIHFHGLLDDACRDQASFAVLYIDLDHFKPINDAFGHEAGNVVLVEFARRLQALALPGCAIGRIGGDEFAILAAPGLGPVEIDAMAAGVLDAANRPFFYMGLELSVSASVGISLFPEHGGCTAELLHTADSAMYASKQGGRNLVSQFSGDGKAQQVKLAGQLALLSQLHHALLGQEFFLEYQPIFDGFGERVMALEALIRWRKANGEIVAPDRFIAIAEQSRLIVHLDRWVLAQVCRDLPLMQGAGMGALQVHVNMSAPEFLDSALAQDMMAILDAAGISPRQICIELTEGVVMSDVEKSIPIMQQLRQLGFDISLDDFGMGYSSLSMLKKLPVSSIKIDRLFVAGLPDQRDECAIVRAILELGRNMKIGVIAEGIENDAQLGFLRQFGCPRMQGYLLDRPMPVASLIARHGQP
jgi:diguanylate cyclase (GGDEF)-like protein